jgi:hypothetical protein
MSKKITSEDIRDGWDTSSVAPKKEDPLAERPKKKKAVAETIEVLNPGSSVSRVRGIPKAHSAVIVHPSNIGQDSDSRPR